MKWVRSAASLVIIVFLAVTSFVCAKGILEGLVSRTVESWLSDEPEIYTSRLTDVQKGELVASLQRLSSEKGVLVVSRDKEHQQSGTLLYTFSVLPASGMGSVALDPLTVLGTTVVDDALLEGITAAGPGDYAGYGNDAFSRVAELPSIRSGLYFRVDRLGSGNNLGVCKLVGLSNEEFQALADEVASSIGVSAETLTTKMSGSSTEMALIYLFCAGAFALLALVLCLLMVTHSLLELKTLGVHLMLGWSRGGFARELLLVPAAQLLVVLPVGALGTLVLLDGFGVSPEVVDFALASVLPAAVAVIVSAVVSVVPLLFVRPVEAIRGRYSRRGFYVLTVAVYLLCVLGIFGGCLYIDQPLAMYSDLARTRSAWAEYENWSVVRDFSLGSLRFTGNPMDFAEELYAWYAAHEHDEGVYLVNASRYERGTIQAYVGSDAAVEPFWYLSASPSYLARVGIDVSEDLIEKAERGVRVYLVPESLDASEKEGVEELLMASRKVYDSNIVTSFMENPRNELVSYDGSRELFTWTTDSELPVAANNFVIAVVTAKNMVPFESESLVASGLENSYIKLDGQAASSLLGEDGSVSLGGTVGARFTSVGNYIDGLRKTLEELFALFSLVLAVLMATVVVMTVCLVDIVNRVSAREISVKYVLGFGAWELYRREILFVTITALAGVAISFVMGSNAGMLVGAALLAVSNLAIFASSRQRSAAVVLETVSKE